MRKNFLVGWNVTDVRRTSSLLALGLLVAISVLIQPATGSAAGAGIRLVMVEEKGCRYCIAWDRDVGHVYAKTAEGRFAPLMRVGREASILTGLAPVVYTPTFIALCNGEEVGRITGYPGPGFFWEELQTLLAPIGFVPVAASRG